MSLHCQNFEETENNIFYLLLQGERGPAGKTGSEGPAGPMGPAGPPGEVGSAGALLSRIFTTTSLSLSNLVGPSGKPGILGARGEQGMPGDVGPKGDRGIEGPQGERGQIGPPVRRHLKNSYLYCCINKIKDTYHKFCVAGTTGIGW